MTTSPYLNHSKDRGEQDLFEDLLIETIQHGGMDVYYLPATRDVVDPILGETVRSSFKRVVKIEAYSPSGGAESGDGELMAKFGYAQRNSLDITLSKKRFRQECEVAGLNLSRPREGDLIFIGDIDAPWASQINEFFEITYVSFNEAQWTFGKTFAYKLSLASYVFSHEKFETSTPLDDIITDIGTDTDMDSAINAAVKTTKATLLAFDKKNPMGNV